MSNSGLIVRRSVRFEISLPARIRVASHHAEALSFAKGITDSNRWIDVDVIDFAEGGLGFMSPVFLPRNGEVEIEIPDHGPDSSELLLRSLVRVQRIQMTDSRPGYKVGGAFQSLDEEAKAQIERVIARLSQECDGQGVIDA